LKAEPRRKVPQTASVSSYRTKKGLRWAARYRDAHGIQRSETQPGFGKQAKAIAEERAREIEQGRWYVAPPQTLGAFLEGWLERHSTQVKHSTWRRRREALRALGVLSERDVTVGRPLPKETGTPGEVVKRLSLSESPLDRLQVADVEDTAAELAYRAPRQAQIALAALKTALADAKRRGQRFDEAILEIKAPRYTGRPPRFLTWAQVLELQSWMPEYVSRIVPVAALTGARQGELFDLRESDLDLDGGIMRIRSGKTQAATRSVNLPATAVQLLREQLLARTHTGGGYVFPAPQGGRWAKDNFMARVFRPARKAAALSEGGVQAERALSTGSGKAKGVGRGTQPMAPSSESVFTDLPFHSLRHTAISLMGAAGIPVSVVAQTVGHKDGGALILKRYRHVFAHESADAALKLDALVRGGETKEVGDEGLAR
jgi:integrase